MSQTREVMTVTYGAWCWMDETQRQAATWENDVQSSLHCWRYAEALRQVSASSHGIKLQVPGRHIEIWVWIISDDAICSPENREQWLGSGVETVEMGGPLMIKVLDRNAGVDYIPKAEPHSFRLMPYEMTNWVLPWGVAAGQADPAADKDGICQEHMVPANCFMNWWRLVESAIWSSSMVLDNWNPVPEASAGTHLVISCRLKKNHQWLKPVVRHQVLWSVMDRKADGDDEDGDLSICPGLVEFTFIAPSGQARF